MTAMSVAAGKAGSGRPRAAGSAPPLNPVQQRRRVWTVWHLLGVFGIVTACVFVTSTAWADLLRIGWHDEESSHVMLVPLVVGWLVWVRRGRLRQCKPGG